MEEVLRREKEEVLASSKSDYASRPLSYKSSLSASVAGIKKPSKKDRYATYIPILRYSH